MAPSRVRIVAISVIMALAGLLSCRGDRVVVKPSHASDWFVLEIEQDGSLTLDGQRIPLRDSAKGFALLAEKARSQARSKGNDLDPKTGVPAGIIVWADDATPFSTLHHAMRESQASGFHRYRFVTKSTCPSLDELPPALNHPTPVVEKNTDLPDAIGTLPIHLHADDHGRIDWVELAEQDLHGFESLERQVTSIGSDADSPFEKALLDVDRTLVFSELVRVVELLGQVGVRTISFRPE